MKPMVLGRMKVNIRLSDRQRQILEMAQRVGYLAVESLAQDFDVTTQTIRKDLNHLCEANLLIRYHGGAGLPTSVQNSPYRERQTQFQDEKRRIAKLLASMIPNYASLFINIGTTNEEIARELVHHEGLRVITNNLHVAEMLGTSTQFDVIVAGGELRDDGGITGTATVDFIRQFRVDFGVIGISGIDNDGTLLEFDYNEVQVARAIMQNSRAIFLASDHSKIGRNALVRLGNLQEVTAFFTDAPLPEELGQLLTEAGVEQHIALPQATETLSV